MLTNESITFGKYQGKSLGHVLKDRGYCSWLKDQSWFRENYEYLYNRICEYEPRSYFLNPMEGECKDFLEDYEFFNLKPVEEISLPLNSVEVKCYEYYLRMVQSLQADIYRRLENEDENPFAIKAPTGWLQKFEEERGIPRSEFKEFLASYDLPNIPYIVKRIKKEGGIDYKGADSFLIAKERSVKQEKWWEEILKERYGESLTVQFTYERCIFDFLNIDTETIFECKLGLKDFCEEQHRKYKLALEKYRIIYLIATDCVVDMEQKKLFTTSPNVYSKYITSIPSLRKPSYLDLLILEDFNVVEIKDVQKLFGK